MRKLSILLVGIAFLLQTAFVSAKEAKTEKPKRANTVKYSAAHFKATPEIVKYVKEYKVKKAKQAKVQATFGQIHMSQQGSDGKSEPVVAMALSQEDTTLPVVEAKLSAIFTYLQNQNDKGHGDIDYWIRTRSLNATQGRIAAGELNRILSDFGGTMNGLLKASLKNITANLQQAMGKYDNGYGDLDYWVAASGYTRDALWQAGANIREVREALAVTQPADVLPVVKGQLEVVQVFLANQTDKGHGTIDYWIRTRSLIAAQAYTGVSILQNLLQNYGAKVQGLLKTAIQNVATNLNSVAQKYNNGYGDLDYWVSASSFTRDGIYSAAKNLKEILGSI